MTTALGASGTAREQGGDEPAGDPFRERLLEGLADSIAQRGYRETTVADIVRNAKTSKRTFYAHFTGKDAALLRAKRSGETGELVEVNKTFLESLLNQSYIPVITPIGLGSDGESYSLDPDAVAALYEQLQPVSFPRGHRVFREGEPGDRLFIITSGTVKFGRNEGVKYPEEFELPDDYTLTRLLSTAEELGVNLLDTSPAYGTSEERLGKLLQGKRERWVIAGKAGEEFENGKSSYNFTAEHFTKSLERTLKRLNTDYLDILLIHSDGSDTKILSDEKLIARLHDFKKKGMVRAIGASTKTPEGGIKALEMLDIVMATYNPAHMDEKPVLDYATKHNKPVLLKKLFASGHVNQVGGMQKAMDFAFQHPGTSSVIVGTLKPERLRANVQAATNALLSAESRART